MALSIKSIVLEVFSHIDDRAEYRRTCKLWRDVIDSFDNAIDDIYRLARSPDTYEQALLLAKDMKYHKSVILDLNNHVSPGFVNRVSQWIKTRIDNVNMLVEEFDLYVKSEKGRLCVLENILMRDNDHAYMRLQYRFGLNREKVCRYVRYYGAVKVFLYLQYNHVKCSLTWPLVSLYGFSLLRKRIDMPTLAYCVRKAHNDDVTAWFSSCLN